MTAQRMMNDRFTVALLLALGLHAAVLLVVSFVFEINPLRKAAETLDVVLVNWRSETPPDEADFLAQAAQKGGGESTEATRPSRNQYPERCRRDVDRPATRSPCEWPWSCPA